MGSEKVKDKTKKKRSRGGRNRGKDKDISSKEETEHKEPTELGSKETTPDKTEEPIEYIPAPLPKINPWTKTIKSQAESANIKTDTDHNLGKNQENVGQLEKSKKADNNVKQVLAASKENPWIKPSDDKLVETTNVDTTLSAKVIKVSETVNKKKSSRRKTKHKDGPDGGAVRDGDSVPPSSFMDEDGKENQDTNNLTNSKNVKNTEAVKKKKKKRERKEWKIAPELIKTKTTKPKEVGSLRKGKGINDEGKKKNKK